jgi:hypothetical protein
MSSNGGGGGKVRVADQVGARRQGVGFRSGIGAADRGDAG